MAKFVEKHYTGSEVLSEELPIKEACHIPVVLASNDSGEVLRGGEYVKLKKIGKEYHIIFVSDGLSDYIVYPFLKGVCGFGEYCYVMLNPNLIKDISHTFNVKFLDFKLP